LVEPVFACVAAEVLPVEVVDELGLELPALDPGVAPAVEPAESVVPQVAAGVPAAGAAAVGVTDAADALAADDKVVVPHAPAPLAPVVDAEAESQPLPAWPAVGGDVPASVTAPVLGTTLAVELTIVPPEVDGAAHPAPAEACVVADEAESPPLTGRTVTGTVCVGLCAAEAVLGAAFGTEEAPVGSVSAVAAAALAVCDAVRGCACAVAALRWTRE
jgi:hypothetical protein